MIVIAGMNPKFHIPNPCSEDWSKMTPTEKGAFCDKCQKEVRDYTNSPIEVIKSEYMAGKHSCIKVQQHKLDELNLIDWYENQPTGLKNKYLLLLAMLFVSVTSKAQDTVENVSIDSTDQISLVDLIDSEAYLDTIYPENTSFLCIAFDFESQFEGNIVVDISGSVPITYGGWGGVIPEDAVIHLVQSQGWIGNIIVNDEKESQPHETKLDSIGKSKAKVEKENQVKNPNQPLPANEPDKGNPFNIPYAAVPVKRKFYGILNPKSSMK